MSNFSDVKKLDMWGIRLSLWGLFLAGSIIIFAVAVVSASGTILTYFLLLVLWFLLLMPLGIGVLSKSRDIFELIYIISALYFLNFLLRSLYILNSPEILHTFNISIIHQTLICVILGFTFLLLGYYSFIPKIICRLIPRPHFLAITPQRAVVRIWLIYTVGILFRLLLFSRGFGFSILPQAQGAELAFIHIMSLLEGFSLFGYALYSIWVFSSGKSRSAFIPWLIMFTIEICFAFVLGWKGAFIPLFLIPLIAYHYFRKRFSVRYIFFAVIIGFLVMTYIVFPVINTSRIFMAHVTGVPRSMKDVVSISVLVFDKLREYSEVDLLQVAWQPVMDRLIGFDHLYLIVRNVPERVNLQMGRTFVNDFFLSWIPRFLWPEKPISNKGRWFTEAFWDVPPDDPVIKSIMNIGDFYLNFHIIGVLFGMFFLGILYKIAHLYFIHYGGATVISVFIYIFVFLGFTRTGMDLATLFLDILQNLFLLFLVSLFLVMKMTIHYRQTVQTSPRRGIK